jgi:16S rRNA (cytidine1402-2'-O)-methyltransferase
MKTDSRTDLKIPNPKIQNPKSRIQNPGCGTLFAVSTPIGNLEDITLRALRILKGVDMIAAENVTHTRGLCRHYGIKSRLTSYNQHNRNAKTPELIKRLRSGWNLALVTDAGTPGISDPGVYLINKALAEEIRVAPIPGPSAVIAGLSVSGLPSEQFLFMGFLSNKKGRRKKELKKLTTEPRTMVFFEAPHRVKEMLADMMEILGDRRMVMLREMTKLFEEVQRGPINHILEHLASSGSIKGEFTLIVEGSVEKEDNQPLSVKTLRRIDELLAEKAMRLRDIAALVSGEEGLTYRQVYKECLARKNLPWGFNTDGTCKEV